MARLTPAYPFRPAGSRAISLIHVSQISGDHRQDEGRKRMVDSQVAVSVDANSLPVRNLAWLRTTGTTHRHLRAGHRLPVPRTPDIRRRKNQ